MLTNKEKEELEKLLDKSQAAFEELEGWIWTKLELGK